MFRRRLFLLLPLFLALAGYKPQDQSFVPPEDYENDASEALVRQMIKELPMTEAPFTDGAPKIYCIVKEAGLRAASPGFVHRFEDLGFKFVSANALRVRKEDERIIDQTTKLSPITLQIRKLSHKTLMVFEAEGAWAYKDRFMVKLFTLSPKAEGGWKVEEVKVIDSGNRKGPFAKKPEAEVKK